jgi:putative endonuclease
MFVPGASKRTVYVLRSLADPERHYVGITSDVERRLEWHNHGPSGQTVRGRPWSISVSITFPEEGTALRFERYLKSGSGRAFAKRHFEPTIRPPSS